MKKILITGKGVMTRPMMCWFWGLNSFRADLKLQTITIFACKKSEFHPQNKKIYIFTKTNHC